MFTRWIKYRKNLRKENKLLYFFLECIEIYLLYIFIIQFFCNTKVVSGSMEPTIMTNDYLFGNKVIFHLREPHRGDIVIFKSPLGGTEPFVKRLIGLPGDKLKMNNGIIYVNGKTLIFPGININRDDDSFDTKMIPSGNYFMMGDNRGDSLDSRAWGYITKKTMIGTAVFVYRPLSRMQILQ